MNIEEPSKLVWFKSTYSDGEGGQCLEVALTWHKSSYSQGDGGQCVEIATCPTTIHVRDSKRLPEDGGPALALAAASWDAFLGFAARG
ncbi:DUF397 domain-containing protein [Streptomyces sp. NBC_01288]|uniref:DUF397 domain-containing protein n=1 Tax=Streptomyces sp. NBC_01288 TaxID=2903814 RepID=UPI002E113564|nr:DUF397 domain-containing protein [Streptomyces sp. NBC_01288]